MRPYAYPCSRTLLTLILVTLPLSPALAEQSPFDGMPLILLVSARYMTT